MIGTSGYILVWELSTLLVSIDGGGLHRRAWGVFSKIETHAENLIQTRMSGVSLHWGYE